MKILSTTFVKGIVGDDKILYDNIRHIAFVGRSNVGKSSTLNALLGAKELARTGKKPGKTLEINFFKVNTNFYFVDLPGYGFAQQGLDQRERIREMILSYITNPGVLLHKVALILDAKVGLTDFDKDMLDILQDNKRPTVVILNKKDRLNQKEFAAQMNAIHAEFPDLEILPYSAKEKKGTGALLTKLVS